MLEPSGDTLAKLIRGIITVENGAYYAAMITAADINEGIAMMGSTVSPVGVAGFSISTLLFGVAVYLFFTRERMPKRKSA
jgi:hypothetical protein